MCLCACALAAEAEKKEDTKEVAQESKKQDKRGLLLGDHGFGGGDFGGHGYGGGESYGGGFGGGKKAFIKIHLFKINGFNNFTSGFKNRNK